MSSGHKLKYEYARRLANRVIEILAPHCQRCETAGSVRREKPDIGDIEIVCIPKTNTDLLGNSDGASDEFVKAVNTWSAVKGDPRTCKYTQRILKDRNANEICKLDIFIAQPDNFGLIYLIRTGSAEHNFKMLYHLERNNLKMMNGKIIRVPSLDIINTPEEENIFELCKMKFVKPQDRK